MISEIATAAKEIGTNATEASKSFDPDAKAEVSKNPLDNKSQGFDPDAKAEVSKATSENEIKSFDPDAKAEPSGTAETKQNEAGETAENKEAEKNEPIQNKQDGLRREAEVETELRKKYPEKDGYKIEREVYLRDNDGNIAKDPQTCEGRRIDFVVTKDGKVVDSVEVTSKTADKTGQSAKEARIRENGGNYIKDSDGNLIEIPKTVTTRIERRD